MRSSASMNPRRYASIPGLRRVWTQLACVGLVLASSLFASGAAPATAVASEGGRAKTLIFIDDAVRDRAELQSVLAAEGDVIWLRSDQDGLSQMADQLRGRGE